MAEEKEFVFTVPGMPIGKGRPRFTRTGRTYTPEDTTEYEEKVRISWKSQCGKTFPGKIAIRVSGTAYFQIPKSASKKKASCLDGQYCLKRPDIDNIVKAILDALNKTAYPDDCVVMLGNWEKVWTNGAPRVEVKVEGPLQLMD